MTTNVDDIKKMIAKAVAEPDFRVQLLRDPAKAAQSIGVALTDQQVTAVKQLGDTITQHANNVDLMAQGTQAGLLVISPGLKVT